ncbi:hypothetical protein EDB19DRAFT_1827939 [Suillus lakei]|nr:hypothetical protein EDB19DRAFT_1827939 [Suillus lakei]
MLANILMLFVFGALGLLTRRGLDPPLEYSGLNGVPGHNGTRLGFCGGNGKVNMRAVTGKHTLMSPHDFNTDYSIRQLGLTADVNCQPIDSTQPLYVWGTGNSSVIYSYFGQYYWSSSVEYQCKLWYQYASDARICDHGGCKWKWEFLRKRLSSDLGISTKLIRASSENVPLLSFIVGVAKYQSVNSQGLGEYWCGVVEFSVTFLCFGFMTVGSFPDGILNDLSSQVNGTMYISTIGWTERPSTYLLAIIPPTIVTFLTFTYSVYYGTRLEARSLKLAGFSQQGIFENEDVEVRLYEDDDGFTQKFMLATDFYAIKVSKEAV